MYLGREDDSEGRAFVCSWKMSLCGELGFLRGIRLRQREAAVWLGRQMWFLCPRWDCDAVGSGATDPLSGSLWCPLFNSCLCVWTRPLFSQFLVPDTLENFRILGGE